MLVQSLPIVNHHSHLNILYVSLCAASIWQQYVSDFHEKTSLILRSLDGVPLSISSSLIMVLWSFKCESTVASQSLTHRPTDMSIFNCMPSYFFNFYFIPSNVLNLEGCLFCFQIVLHAKLDLWVLLCQTLSKCVFQSICSPTVPVAFFLCLWTTSSPLCF